MGYYWNTHKLAYMWTLTYIIIIVIVLVSLHLLFIIILASTFQRLHGADEIFLLWTIILQLDFLSAASLHLLPIEVIFSLTVQKHRTSSGICCLRVGKKWLYWSEVTSSVFTFGMLLLLFSLISAFIEKANE